MERTSNEQYSEYTILSINDSNKKTPFGAFFVAYSTSTVLFFETVLS